MDLIKRYVHAVGKRIWNKQREDIEKEIESTLYDMLDERTQGREYTDDDVVQLLKEYGSPSKVASTYNDCNYLIGPELFGIYVLVLRIVLLAVTIGLSVAMITDLVANVDKRTLNEALMLIPEYGAGLLNVFASVTLVFAGIQFFGKKNYGNSLNIKEDWDPKTLPQVSKSGRKVKIVGPIISSFGIVILLIILNLYSNNLGIVFSDKGINVHSVISQESLNKYLLPWDFILLGSFILNIIYIFKREWSIRTRIWEIVIALGSIAILASMIIGPDIFDVASFKAAYPDKIKEFDSVYGIVSKVLKVFFGFAIVANIFDIGKKVRDIIKK